MDAFLFFHSRGGSLPGKISQTETKAEKAIHVKKETTG
jgi:hypothetical protein